jgi:hypothetical protein
MRTVIKQHAPWARALAATASLAMLVVACSPGGTSSEEADSDQAQQLAQQFATAITDAGYSPPPEGTIKALYGEDGGVSCAQAGGLGQVLGLAGFGNPSYGGRRILDPQVKAYDEAVINTYCPDKLEDYQEILGQTKTEQSIP